MMMRFSISARSFYCRDGGRDDARHVSGADHDIMKRETGEVDMVRDDGLNYLMKLYVIPPALRQPFAGQVGAP